jgi:UDP-2,3-diacylglucosamine hydrolase
MIAIIAGTGSLPGEACKNLLARKEPFFVITLFPENNAQSLQQIVGDQIEVVAQEFYKPSEILSLMKSKGTTKLLFIGKVDKSNLLKHVSFDWLAVKMLGSMIGKSDKNIMEALIAELSKHNIQVIKQDEVLGGLLVPPGILTGTLTTNIENDIKIGIDAAIAIAHADIGQTVVVKNGMILAVEAIEGTDACIKRGIELGKENIVICKVARLDQNKKFDLPTLGPTSLKEFKSGDVAAIAWQSSSTLIAQKDEFIQKAKNLGITLVSVKKS